MKVCEEFYDIRVKPSKHLQLTSCNVSDEVTRGPGALIYFHAGLETNLC